MNSSSPLALRTKILFLVAIASAGLLAAQAAKASTAISQAEEDYARNNAAAPVSAADIPKCEAKEVNARGGIPNFLARAKKGEALTVGYFGGSITAHEGWRPQSFAMLQERFPNAKLTMLAAAIGGTGSLVGAFRADRDLIQAGPDLVFVEFAVNDGGDAKRFPEKVLGAMEGIVRKIRARNPLADIVFVYTLQGFDVDAIKGGFYQVAPSVHEMVARHYDLPSIHMGVELVKLIGEDKAVFQGPKGKETDDKGRLIFSDDNTHPTIPAGHRLYAEAVKRGFDAFEGVGTPGARELGAPLRPDHWQKAKSVAAEGKAKFTGNWDGLTAENGPACGRYGKRIYEWFPRLWRSTAVGDKVSFRFKGTYAGIKGLQGPDGGVVQVELDGKPFREDVQFSAYHNRFFYSTSPPEGPFAPGVHEISFTLTDKPVDKRKILQTYYRKGNDKAMDDHPEWFVPQRFSVGEILLIGDFIDEAGNVVP